MELRGCNHLHFISVIRGCEVIKVPNISAARKALHFKNISEIISSNSIDSPEKMLQKVDRSFYASLVSGKANTKIKIECDEEDSDSDLGAMTLKEFKDTIKSKKRKKLGSVSTYVKQEFNDLPLEEDETDLVETIGSWKRKLFKKQKVKKTRSINCTPITSETDILEARLKEIPSDLALHQTNEENLRADEVKVKITDPEYFQPHATSDAPGGSNFGSELVEEMPLEDLQSGNLSETSSLLESMSIPSEIQNSYLIQVPHEYEGIKIMSPSQESTEHLGYIQLKPPLVYQDSDMENIAHLGNDSCPDLPIFEQGNVENMTDLRMSDKAPEIMMSKCESPRKDESGHANSSHYVELIENGESIEFIDDNENSEVEISTAIIDCSSIVTDDTSLVSTNDGVPKLSVLNDGVASLACSPNVQHHENTDEVNTSASNESYQDKKVVHPSERLCSPKKVLFCKDESLQEQHLGTDHADSCQYVEILKNGKLIKCIDDNENSEVGGSCLPSTDDVAPTNTLTSFCNNKELAMLNNSVATQACSPEIQHNEDIDEVDESALDESYQDKEVMHPPERLFSPRKTISPNSQRRLCRALKSIDLQCDNDVNCCKEKLPYGKDCDDPLKGSEASNSAEIANNKRQSAKKGKEEKKGLRFKGNMVKSPNTSQRTANDSTSVQSCSRNAIKFSQQQLHDIERLATKLLTELQSMKGIVIDGMQCESRASAKSIYNTDEVRVAVENANKTEETAKKWLSIMTRDCNRFCKIMTLADANAASSETLSPEKNSQKERKKIVFADEAGGSLCHVRVFEAGVDIDSPLKSPTTDEKLST